MQVIPVYLFGNLFLSLCSEEDWKNSCLHTPYWALYLPSVFCMLGSCIHPVSMASWIANWAFKIANLDFRNPPGP